MNLRSHRFAAVHPKRGGPRASSAAGGISINAWDWLRGSGRDCVRGLGLGPVYRYRATALLAAAMSVQYRTGFKGDRQSPDWQISAMRAPRVANSVA